MVTRDDEITGVHAGEQTTGPHVRQLLLVKRVHFVLRIEILQTRFRLIQFQLDIRVFRLRP